MKTADELQQQFFRYTAPPGIAVVGLIVLVSLWALLIDEVIGAHWFPWPNTAFFSPVPLLVAAAMYALYRAIRQGYERQPFFAYAGAVHVVVPGLVHQHLSLHRPAQYHHLGRGRAAI